MIHTVKIVALLLPCVLSITSVGLCFYRSRKGNTHGPISVCRCLQKALWNAAWCQMLPALPISWDYVKSCREMLGWATVLIRAPSRHRDNEDVFLVPLCFNVRVG